MHLRCAVNLTGRSKGVPLDQFRWDLVYDLGSHLASVFLAEGWAEPVTEEGVRDHHRAPAWCSSLMMIGICGL
jgi:hypothetical protein